MRPLFHPRLVNGPFGDPALYVECLHNRKALLFDAGELHSLSPRKLLKISHVFVTHTHMDHFIGFDHLVRLMLGRPKHMVVFGPAPLIDQVASRLASYSWNLAAGYKERLVLEVVQLSEDRIDRAILDCRDGFVDPCTRESKPFESLIYEEPLFRVKAAILDHKIPSIGYCLEEPRHVQVIKEKLEEYDLEIGPWIRDLKEAIYRNLPPDHPIQVSPPEKGPVPLGRLRDRVVRIAPGQRIGYVADVGYDESNRRKILSLAGGVDILFIEAAFLHVDLHRAEATSHLTAYQAGRLAAEAGAARVEPFHFSNKYEPDGRKIAEEVEAAFRSDRSIELTVH